MALLGSSSSTELLFTTRMDASQAIREIGKLRATISADVKAIQSDVGNSLGISSGMMSGIQSVARVAAQGLAAIAGAGLALGTAAVTSATQLDSLKRGLVAVSGSSEAAEAQLVRLREVAKLPGLGFQEAIQGSINLQAAGFSAEFAERALKGFGNALATVGKGKAELDGINLALTQMATSPKVLQEEINQIRERLPQFTQLMISAFGTARSEDIQKLGISGKQFAERMVTELEKLPRVTGGAQNAFENLQDTAKDALTQIGNELLPEVLKAVEELTGAVGGNGAAWRQLGRDMGDVVRLGSSVAKIFVEIGEKLNWLETQKARAAAAITAGLYAAAPGQMASIDALGRLLKGKEVIDAPWDDPYADRAAANARNRAGGKAAGGSGGRGSGGAGKKGSNEAQQRELQQNALFFKELESITRTNREVLEREYELSLKNLEDYYTQAHRDNEEHYEHQQRGYNRQEEIARQYIKNQKDLTLRLAEIDLERADAKDARDKETRRLEDEKQKQQIESAIALNRQLADTQESIRAGMLARAEAQAEAGIISQTQLEQRRHDLQQEAFNDQKLLLEMELTQFGISADEKTRIGNALIRLDQDRAAAAEAASRRIIGAIQAEQSVRLPDPSGLGEAEANARAGSGKALIPNPEADPVPPNYEGHMSAIKAFQDFAMNAWGSISQGFGSMVQSFLTGGKLSGQAFASMVKSITAALAAQATVEAVMQLAHAVKEYAMASASAAVFDFRGAALHTAAATGHLAAAAAYGIVGAASAAVSLAIPGGASAGRAGASAGMQNQSDYASGPNRRPGIDVERRGIVENRGASEPQRVHLTLDVALEDGTIIGRRDTILDVWRDDFNNAGERTRELLRRDLLGEWTGY